MDKVGKIKVELEVGTYEEDALGRIISETTTINSVVFKKVYT